MPSTEGGLLTTGPPRKSLLTLCCAQSHLSPTWHNPVARSLPGCSAHGILQVRKLEWVAMPSSRGSSQPTRYTTHSDRQKGMECKRVCHPPRTPGPLPQSNQILRYPVSISTNKMQSLGPSGPLFLNQQAILLAMPTCSWHTSLSPTAFPPEGQDEAVRCRKSTLFCRFDGVLRPWVGLCSVSPEANRIALPAQC